MIDPKDVTEYATTHNITKAAAAKRLLRMQNATDLLSADDSPDQRADEPADDPTDLEGEGAG